MKRAGRIYKRLFPLGWLIALAAVLAVGGSAAYFRDSDEVTNTFTMGNIKISLGEPGWNPSDGLNLRPGSAMTKDPTVEAVKGRSYMRIRMEIVDGGDRLISDPERLALILNTLFYDKAYGTAAPALTATGTYTKAELRALSETGRIHPEYNRDAFLFAGIESGRPAVRYYHYIGIFDAGGTPADTAVLFTSVVIPTDWVHGEILILNGDTYTTNASGGHEITAAGTGYKIRLTAEAIQAAEMAGAEEAFRALDDAVGVTRDTDGT